MKRRLVVLTGAGVSAESGISTFRDSNGLWEQHKVEDVASIEGWYRNPELVLEFYNQRRHQLSGVKPNPAHFAIAELEKDWDVTVITQNVDNLHERAGSTRIIHLHGELTKVRASMVCEPSLAFCARDLELGKFLLLGKGEDITGGRHRDSIISDAMEAVTGAIFLDGGMEPAKQFIYRFILSDIEDKQLFYDSKSNLQELIQGKLKKDFHYELRGEKGPEHDKIFCVEVLMGDEVNPRREFIEENAKYVKNLDI